MLKRFLPSLFLLLSSVALFAQVSPLADSAHFVINQGNHAVGRSDFSIQSVRQGNITTPGAYAVNSHGTLTLQKTSYSFSNSGSLDSSLRILEENLNGIVNGEAVNFSVRPTGDAFAIGISANGTNSHNSLHTSGPTVFFPDFDLASYDILLNLRARNPGAPISALIPKQTGYVLPATIASQVDVQGTLAGRAITVHHVSLTIGSVTSELYYSTSNRILEVDIPSQTFAIVHDNFQLQAPPPPPPNTSQPNQQPAGAVAPQQNQ